MESAFGVDHGHIEKIAVKQTGFKLPKPGKLFGRPGSLNRTGGKGKKTPFQQGQAVGGAMRGGFSAVGSGAGKAAGAAGFQRAGQAMQNSPVKAGVTTSFLAGGVGYGAYGAQKKRGGQNV